MEFQDRTIACKECSEDFVFTAGEQEFYAEKGFENEPQRCPDCRKARKQRVNNRREKEMFNTTCSSCGVETQVPFKPNGLKPVYCRDCFRK
ncbi:CxxC-x17-CxxC domain-containing protein [Desulfonispora thiosulfatigenes DSM 11270]|uniref:CxxC-x17-CxxC domain-containing protein n=1 Tax=Desulfonispora thiosulfatigenes DSM 11270 TaxID=656914 RepID=A0A1W1UQM5_DESTI|nr:zinc-ribbon domain containing protein [Desulfonispora thiosulfatigenes]SMB83299.1 CxxC-x17-CxxC domain-containing protein [Desulfonispora thiosulfatigenes DSM 11270]